MRNNATTIESDPEVLESYFKKYPDVPKETILKKPLESRSLVLAMPRSKPRQARW